MKCELQKVTLTYILFIDILIYLEVFKNTLCLMKFNTDEDVAEKTNVKYWKSSYIILFYFMRYTREKIEV